MKKHVLSLFIIGLQLISFAQDNQNVELSKIESGSYPVYKMLEKGYEKYVFELAKKHWPVELFSEGDIYPKILIKRVGIIDEFYNSDLPTYPAYYLTTASSINITVLNKKIYYYKWTASQGATISYILSKNKPSSYINEKSALDSYRRTIKTAQTGARDVRKKTNADIAHKEEEANTLKGKKIKSIKVKLVDPNSDAGMFSVIAIGMEVTLTNGKILKTKNLGGKTPYEDFSSTVGGGNFAGGDFKVNNDTREIVGDKITLKVWSKYDNTVKGSLSHPLNYKNDVYYHYQGNGGSHGRGGVHGRSVHGSHGKDGKNVNITAEKMTINGHNITKITVTDANAYRILSEAKIHINNRLTLNIKGGNGGNGADGHFSGDNGGNGGDGGNGGNVSVNGSGAVQLKATIQTQGGNAGSGGKGKETYNQRGSNGSRGKNGTSNK